VVLRNALLLTFAAALLARGDSPSPETTAAFDRYIGLAEAEMQARSTPEDFLWLDQHRKEKTAVWMSQNFLIPEETLDHGKKVEIPGASIQHWLGAVYLETATFERVRDMLLDYGNYKNFFKQQIVDSRLIKRDGDRFDASLRLRKKQITQVVLSAAIATEFKSLDTQRSTITTRSIRIGEAEHGNKTSDQEISEQNGYLWRLNFYWRLEAANPGVYAELELISLSPSTGTLRPGRYLNGFQTFPRELAQSFLDGLAAAFPAPRK